MKQFQIKSEIGKIGETLAKKYIIKKGHRLLAQNYYFEFGKRKGEIDIISELSGVIHFIEVKTRTQKYENKKSPALFYPIEATVTRAKLQKCLKSALQYLHSTRQEKKEYHFDVITVLYNPQKKTAEIQYLPDVFY